MKADITDMLDSLDVAYRWVDHAAVFTVEEASRVIQDKTPVKNLLLQEKKGGRLFLVIMSGECQLDVKKLGVDLGAKKLSFAKPEVLKSVLGVAPGAVSLFGLLHDEHDEIKVVIDRDLLEADEIGFHPSDNTSSVFIAGAAIEKILQYIGSEYQVMQFAAQSD